MSGTDELGQKENVAQSQGTFVDREDAGKGEQGEVRLWMQAIELADAEEEPWRKRASETLDIYRDAQDRTKKRYNILYSNTEVISQAVYSMPPIPDVRRRYADDDPVGMVVSQVLERALMYSIDVDSFDATIKAGVKDYCLPGRAVARVRYRPYMQSRIPRVMLAPGPDGQMMRVDNGEYLAPDTEWKTDPGTGQNYIEEGEPYEALAYEETCVEHCQWADFRRGPGKLWDDVPWIAFRHYVTRDQAIELNKDIGAKITLDTTTMQDGKYYNADNGTAPAPEIFKRACVWEIWDKEKREVVWIAPGWASNILRKDKDPLGLKQFFPIPRPMYAVDVPETLVPVELYRLYKDQAEELDVISRRLTALTRVVKWRGFYAQGDAGGQDLTNLQAASDGDLVPAQSVYSVAATGADIGKYIWLMPIREAADVIKVLTERQERIKTNIYELTGISDILRGQGADRETATVGRIKSQWGSLRLRNPQKEVQRYARDLLRLMAGIIAEKFQKQTLELMTNMQIPDEVMSVLRNDALRCFKVDIETDSTIEADLAQSQENAVQFTQGLANYAAAMAPMVKDGIMDAQSAMTMFVAFSRMWKLPRQVVDLLEKLPKQAAQSAGQPKPQDAAQQAKTQAEIARAQADVQTAQIDGQNAQQRGQVDMQKTMLDAQTNQAEHQNDMQRIQAQTAATLIAARAKANVTPFPQRGA